MIVVGLTGGIGSGKSTVSSELRTRGAVVIDADKTTRDLQQPGQEVFAQIVERFGSGVVTAAGDLDRLGLAAIVFPDPEALAALNAIVHPAVGRSIMAQMNAERGTDNIVVLDIPLLVENSRYPVAGVIVVDTPVETAIERLVEFRGMSVEDARARMARQASREERLQRADFVVDNGGTRQALLAQIPELWEWITTLAPYDPDDRQHQTSS